MDEVVKQSFIKRHPIISCIIAVIALCLFGCLICIWLFYSEGDLNWAREYAKEKGLPITLPELKSQKLSSSLKKNIEEINIIIEDDHVTEFIGSEEYDNIEDISFDSYDYERYIGFPGFEIHSMHKKYYQDIKRIGLISKIKNTVDQVIEESPILIEVANDSVTEETIYDITDINIYSVKLLVDYALVQESERQNVLQKILKLGLIERSHALYSYVIMSNAYKLMCIDLTQVNEDTIDLMTENIEFMKGKFNKGNNYNLALYFDGLNSLENIYCRTEVWEAPDRCFKFLLARRSLYKCLIDLESFDGDIKSYYRFCKKNRESQGIFNSWREYELWDDNMRIAKLISELIVKTNLLISVSRNSSAPSEISEYYNPIIEDGFLIGYKPKTTLPEDSIFKYADTIWLHGYKDSSGKVYFAREVPCKSEE